jgi:adenylyltransferase/sulfurtransferase
MFAFSESQIHRYARHILLPEVGGSGQAKLLAAKVLVVGAGGLGSPLILYLAAAGIGRIGVIDDDRVELSNLQRQILHGTDRIGMAKVESARQSVAAINPEVTLDSFELRLTADNAAELLRPYDLIADGSDNLATRLLVNDTARALGKSVVSAAVLRFEGQLSTFKPGGPCYRCLYPGDLDESDIASCAQAGVLGAMAGVMGSLQALEVVKEILGIGDSMAGHLLLIDGLAAQSRKIRLKRDPACPCCSKDIGHGS